MTDYDASNLEFLQALETSISHELEKTFGLLEKVGTQQVDTLKNLLSEIDPQSNDTPVSPERLGPAAYEIVWSDVSETLVGTCLDRILRGESGEKRYIQQSDLDKQWRANNDPKEIAQGLGISTIDLEIALGVTVKFLLKRKTWQGAPEIKQDGRLYKVLWQSDSLEITSQKLPGSDDQGATIRERRLA